MRRLACVVSLILLVCGALWFVFRDVPLFETKFSIQVHGPTENLVKLVGSLRKESFADQVLAVSRSEGVAMNLSKEEIRSSIGSVTVRYDSKSNAELMFSVKARSKEDSYGIARAYLKAAEGGLTEQNQNLERCGLAQLKSRVVKLQRKLEKKGRDAEIEKSLSNAVDRVHAVQASVAKDRIEILCVQFPKDVCQ